MKWYKYPDNKPKESGLQLVSITTPIDNGSGKIDSYTFNAHAFYDSNEDKWFKHDPYTDATGDDITEILTGWHETIPTYLG